MKKGMSAFLARKHRVSGLGVLHYTRSIPSLLLLSCAPHWPSSSCSMAWHPIVQSDSTHLPFLSSAMSVVSEMTLYLPLSTFHFGRELGDTSGAVNWLTVFLLLSLVFPSSMEWQSSLSKDFLMQHVALVWFLGLANSLWAGKKESELFPEVKLRAGTSLWWLHHRTETWNFSFIGHCKSVTSLPSSQILLGSLFHEISCPFSSNGACGVTFLDLSVALGDLSSRDLKTPFPRPLAAGFLSHLC